jgi:hypothetical protein
VNIEIKEVNVPPDYISLSPSTITVFDDAPIGTIVAFASAYDHNTLLADSLALLSMTPCYSPLSSNTAPEMNSSQWVLPTNCTSGMLSID